MSGQINRFRIVRYGADCQRQHDSVLVSRQPAAVLASSSSSSCCSRL
eukprot:COSAG01_NODE_49954_length_367_cov_3.902985_1_plen_46_part_10